MSHLVKTQLQAARYCLLKSEVNNRQDLIERTGFLTCLELYFAVKTRYRQ